MDFQVKSHWLLVSGFDPFRLIHPSTNHKNETTTSTQTPISNVSTTITMDHDHDKPKSSVEVVVLPFGFPGFGPVLSHGIAYSVALLDAPCSSPEPVVDSKFAIDRNASTNSE